MTIPAIETLLRQPAAQAIGWALLQFVWQGAAIGAVTALALATLRRGAADIRYIVASVGLALMLTLPIVTAVQKFQALTTGHGGLVSTAVVNTLPLGARAFDEPSTIPSSSRAPDTGLARSVLSAARSVPVERVLPTMMLVWVAGVLILSLRLLTGWLWVQRLRTRGVSPATIEYRQLAARLARRLHISRAVTLLESTLVDVPTVIGFLKPVILLPATAVSGLSLQQLEAILAHELAHIRRHDYLVNLLQTLVETVLFYHPAVWWVSRRIRIERENCCDDLAVSLCGDPVAYAMALADLESLRSDPAPDHHIAMAATAGSLLLRVRRLLGVPSSHIGRGPAWLAGSVALLLLGGIALGADGLRPEPSPAVLSTAADIQLPPPPAPPSRPAPIRDSVPPAPAPPEPLPDGPPAPMPPAPPAPPAQSQRESISHRVNNSSGNWVWSSNGDKLEVYYSGTFEFTDDEMDVRQMSSGGYLKISDGAWLGRHSVEIQERGGKLEHHYYVNGSERAYEPEGRVWLQQNLPKFVRNTGIDAPARVARFLKSGGVPAVLGEVGKVGSTYVKGIYFRELFKQATLTPEEYRQVMGQASREMRSSDYELAQLLISIAERLPADESSRAAYFTAASGITSDYELRRVYSTMLRRGPVSPQILANILEHSTTIDSDYELSELLRQILSQQPLDDRNRAAFFKAIAGIDSGYERGRVLQAVVRKPDASDDTLREVFAVSKSMTGFELGQLLQLIVRTHPLSGSLREAYVQAADRLSEYEQGQALAALVRSERKR